MRERRAISSHLPSGTPSSGESPHQKRINPDPVASPNAAASPRASSSLGAAAAGALGQGAEAGPRESSISNPGPAESQLPASDPASPDAAEKEKGSEPADISDFAACSAERLGENTATSSSTSSVSAGMAAAASAAMVGKDGTVGCTVVGQEKTMAADATAEEGDAAAAAAAEEHERNQQEELITPRRILELVEVCRATEESFRELIRFVGRTLSNPACVSASFALPPPPPGQAPPRNNAHGREAGKHEQFQAQPGRRPPGDASSASNRSTPSTATATLETILDETPEAPPASPENSAPSPAAIEAEPASATVADDGGNRARSSPAAALPDASGDAYEWRDRSPFGMDVKSAAEVWKLLVELDAERVTGAVLNALDSLSQTLLVQSFLARQARGEGAPPAAAIAAAAPSFNGAAREGGGGRDGGGGEKLDHSRTKADIRTILLGEHAQPLALDFQQFLWSGQPVATPVFVFAALSPRGRRRFCQPNIPDYNPASFFCFCFFFVCFRLKLTTPLIHAPSTLPFWNPPKSWYIVETARFKVFPADAVQRFNVTPVSMHAHGLGHHATSIK